jgi:recombination protein RecA
MSPSELRLEELLSRAEATRAALQGRPSRTWSFAGCAGRLVELSGAGATATLTLAFTLVLDAQQRGDPAAWITTTAEGFYPPDVAEGGVDLDALVVVRVPDARAVARAADRLARSGAFGVIVLDLGAAAEIPTPLQARLAGLAETHHTALVCLTAKGPEAPSLGSLVSLRVHAQRKRIAGRRCSLELIVLKDKRAGPTWGYREVCRGPAGLR